MTLAQVALLVVSGCGAGLVGSLLGIGGGILIVPVLVLALHAPMHTAIATSLLCVVATSSVAASRNIRKGVANVRLGITLELATVLGALVGSSLAGFLSGQILMVTFAAAMALMSIPMARGVADVEEPTDGEEAHDEIEGRGFIADLDGSYYDPAESADVLYRVRRLPLAMTVSGFAGILSGLLGVGGGIVKVPILTSFCDVPMKAAAATSNFMIGVTAAAGALIYYGRGHISPVMTAAALVGVFAGSRAGSHLAPNIRGRHLRKAFAILMVLVAAQLLYKAVAGDAR